MALMVDADSGIKLYYVTRLKVQGIHTLGQVEPEMIANLPPLFVEDGHKKQRSGYASTPTGLCTVTLEATLECISLIQAFAQCLSHARSLSFSGCRLQAVCSIRIGGNKHYMVRISVSHPEPAAATLGKGCRYHIVESCKSIDLIGWSIG